MIINHTTSSRARDSLQGQKVSPRPRHKIDRIRNERVNSGQPRQVTWAHREGFEFQEGQGSFARPKSSFDPVIVGRSTDPANNDFAHALRVIEEQRVASTIAPFTHNEAIDGD